MYILLNIALTQIILLFSIHLVLHPSSPLADKLEKRFGDYGKGLDIIMGIQLLGLFVTGIIAIWTLL